jgi:curved DNA-binding protein CbpA
MMGVDYYQVLGVNRDAGDKAIRQAYRALALRYHPDKNNDDGAEESFKKVAEAYEVLSDNKKRKNYNKYTAINGTLQQKPQHGFSYNWFFNPSDPFDLFKSCFGHHDPFHVTGNGCDPFTAMFHRHMQIHQHLHNQLHHRPLNQLSNIFNTYPFFHDNHYPSLFHPMRPQHPPPPPTMHGGRTTGQERTIEIVLEKREEPVEANKDSHRNQDEAIFKNAKRLNKENRKVTFERIPKPPSSPQRKPARKFPQTGKLSQNQQQSLNNRLCRPARNYEDLH